MNDKVTLYIRDADKPVWQSATESASRQRISLSQLVTRLLAEYVQSADKFDSIS